MVGHGGAGRGGARLIAAGLGKAGNMTFYDGWIGFWHYLSSDVSWKATLGWACGYFVLMTTGDLGLWIARGMARGFLRGLRHGTTTQL